MSSPRNLLAAFVIVQLSLPATAQTTDALKSELSSIDQQIAQAEQDHTRYDHGAIQRLAEMRRQALLLSRVVLENRILAAKGGEPLEVAIPAIQPDAAKANQILGEMADAQRRIEEALRAAEESGGLIKAVALTRVETEKLTLAQLQMAYLQAKYGVVFPKVPATLAGVAPRDRVVSVESPVSGSSETEVPTWADRRFPSIDYSLRPFEQAHREGKRIAGWWTIKSELAPVDDSPQVTAINYSAHKSNSFRSVKALLARCTEGETALIFVQDEFLLSDYDRNTFDIIYRIDDAMARRMRWSGLINNKGAGLFGRDAESFLRQLYDAKRLFIRLLEKNGQKHDAIFDLSGVADVFDQVAGACDWSSSAVSEAEYRAIQILLIAAGFNAGPPDGRWGPVSEQALRSFQASVGLTPTGVPDPDTLSHLGFGGRSSETQFKGQSRRTGSPAEVPRGRDDQLPAERAAAERRREEERSRRELLAREQQRLDQGRTAIFAKALEEYIGAIQSSVVRNWRRPTGVPAGLRCTVSVVQANNGRVLRVEITQSSGNVAFDRSVEQAVLSASPLPPPKQRALFDREIVFLFNPRS